LHRHGDFLTERVWSFFFKKYDTASDHVLIQIRRFRDNSGKLPLHGRAATSGEASMSPKNLEPEIGPATSAVLVSLLNALLEKSILSNAEVRALLTRAAYGLHPHEYTAPAEGAAGIILNDMLPRFPEDGGD
jgi:hypothetical protein